MNEKTIRVGIIGNGAIAHSAHLPALSTMNGVEIVGIMGRDYEKAKATAKSYGIPYTAKSLDELLRQDLEAAVLLTPKTVRREFLLPLIDAKVDILVEKPLASTLAECEYLADVSAKSGQIVMVAFNRRFSPINKQGIAEFKDKAPGLVVCNKSREFKEYRATLENSIHMVDMMRYILGECVSVKAEARWNGDPFYEDLCTAQLCFENGAVGVLCASRQAGQWYERIEMFGDNKSVIMESPDRLTVIKKDHEEVYNSTPLNKGWANYVDNIGFRGCDQHFIDCVRSREKPLTSAEDAFKTHELMNRILHSAGLPDLTNEWSK
ncbi:Gfo/Idh/MocA family protein [Dysosmobacter sp.]|uniref:Gfo/Idh/MocA family protein n=1 Tax=Dysosmobacter sp. TaxID=2591382 RepID=UPI003AB6FB7D